jgi:hypothetical protein
MSTESRLFPFRGIVRKFNDLEFQINLAISFYESLNTPRSLALAIMLRYGEYDQIAKQQIDPLNYLRSDRFKFRDDYHATCYLSKSSWLPCSFDRKEVALKSFIDSEIHCKVVNGRFRDTWEDPSLMDPGLHAILHLAQLKISGILGSPPHPTKMDFGFGPGSSSSCGGDKTSSYEKVQSWIEMTPGCLPLRKLLAQYPSWLGSQPNPIAADGLPTACLIKGSKLLFVPKSAKTDRSICIEPHFNGFIQAGVGRYMRKRLLSAGIDLSDQSKNASLSRLGSLNGSLSTIDLSAASDSISYNLVVDLISPDWLTILDAARSPVATYDGQDFLLEKFSSMGNGYTFELESLLFYSLVWATASYNNVDTTYVSVYGDDIICPTSIYDKVLAVLHHCGFSANSQKSFSSGYFRESCGAHWFDGLNCKPVYFKEGIKNAYDLYKYANSVRRLSHRNCVYGCDGRFQRAWEYCLQSLRSTGAMLLYGPEGFGDGYLIANWDQSAPRRILHRHGTPMYRTCFVHQCSKVYVGENQGALYAYALYRAGPQASASGEFIDFRRRVRTKLSWLYHHQWYDLGPWI